jgi:dihydrofolate synthase/folylpolyglutamate synthase
MAARVLSEFLAEFHPEGVRMIFGAMRDKNYEAMLKLLLPQAREIVFTKPASPRAIEPTSLRELVPGAHVEPTLADAIEHMRATASPEETVLICGSLYLVGEARAVLL